MIKWYTWNEVIELAQSRGYMFYGWKGSHMVVKKDDRYVHIPYRKKIRSYIYKKIDKKLE